VEGPIDNLNIDALGGANVVSLLNHIAYDKTSGVEDDFADMPLIEDASDHERSPSGVVHSHFGFPRTEDAKEFTCCFTNQGIKVRFSYDSY